MQSLKILNKRELKPIFKYLKEQFGYDEPPDLCFLKNNKEKIYIINKDISRIDLSKLRINSIGLYFGTIAKEGFRLSIEGAQMIAEKATKGFLDLDKKNADMWRQGMDLDIESDLDGFVLVRYEDDILGCGKVKDGRVLNYVPKSRRLIVIND